MIAFSEKNTLLASFLRLVTLLLLLSLSLVFISCKEKGEKPSDASKSEESIEEGGAASGMQKERESSWKDLLPDLSLSYYHEAAWQQPLGGFGDERAASFPASASTPAPAPGREGPFTLSAFGPEGDLPSEIRKPTVWMLFSSPVIPLARIGETSSADTIVSIKPEISGTFRWYGTGYLVFQADGEVLPQREYQVSINRAVQSLDGRPLTGRNSFSFRSEELAMRRVLPGGGEVDPAWNEGGVPPEEADEILITFNYPVDLETVSDYIRVESDEYRYTFTFRRPDKQEAIYSGKELEHLLLLDLNEEPLENREVSILLLPGAKSRSDFIGRREIQVSSFHTLHPFGFRRYRSWSYQFTGEPGAANPIYLEFTHPPKLKEFHQRLRFTPPLPVEPENVAIQGNTVRLSNLPVEFESNYRLYLDPSLEDIHGRSLGASKTVEIEIPEAARYANFPNTGTRMLEAQFPPRIVFDYQNIEQGLWKAGPVEDPYTFWPPEALEPYPFPELSKNSRHFETIDLSPWLGRNGKGWLGLSWNFGEIDQRTGKRPKWSQRNLTLQVTDLALTVRYGYQRVVAWVSSLSSGLPLEGAQVTLMANQEALLSDSTDSSGLAVFHLEEGAFNSYFRNPSSDWNDLLRIRVEHQGDRIEFKPNHSHNHWRSSPVATSTPVRVQEPTGEIFLFTDRGLYKPGETLTYRGIDRTLELGSYEVYQGAYGITISEDTWRGEKLFEDGGITTESGGLYGTVELPEDIRPGYYRIEYKRRGGSGRVSFQVAEFERLKFQMDLSIPDRIYYAGDDIPAQVQASYLSGGAISQGRYDYSWTREHAWFAPPGKAWEEYRFGPGEYGSRDFLSQGEGILDPSGSARFSQGSESEGGGNSWRYRTEVRVEDAGGQQIASRKSVLVHPASFYIGARLKRKGWSWFVQKGEAVELDWVLASPDGDPYRGSSSSLSAVLYRKDWKVVQQQGVYGRINSRYELQLKEIDRKEIDPNGTASGRAKSGKLSFTPPTSGSYLIRLAGTDPSGREALTELSFYATGSGMVRWGFNSSDMIELEGDKHEYQVGDTAKLLVKSPLPEGNYLLTVEREGILEESIIHLEGSAQVIGVPIREEHLPVVYVTISSYSVRSGPPEHSYFEPDLDKPKGYFGLIPLMVSTDSRSFDITIETDKPSYRPGEEAEVTLTASREGEAVEGAEITFLAVDRGVLDLIDYHVPDPLAFFYDPRKFPLATAGADSRSLLIDPVTYEVKDLQGGGGEEGKLEEREDFRPLAVFEPYALTDRNGRAVIRFTLPDNLTSYRCTAIGVKGNNFARSEDELVARNPVELRTVMPERLRHRDTVEGGVTVTNLSNDPIELSVRAESRLLRIEGESERAASVAPGQTLLLNFLFSAPEPGEGKILFTLRSPLLNERVVKELEVIQPQVFETVSTGGGMTLGDEPGGGESSILTESLILPSYPDGGGRGDLQLTLSASKLPLFEDAVDYLLDYPFDCFEQRSARLVPYLLFGETGAFPARQELALPRRYVAGALFSLAQVQRADGGIPWWENGTYSSWYVTCRVAQSISLAKGAGFPLPDELDIDKMLAYLRNPPNYVKENPYLQALGLYSRALLGDSVAGEARIFRKGGDTIGLSGYALAGLASAHSGDSTGAEESLKRISSFIRPSSRTLDLTDTWESRASWYGSQIEKLSLLLMLLQRSDPESPLREQVLETLLQRRKSKGWTNTVESSWTLIAVAGELGLSGVPDIRAQITLNGESLSKHHFDSVADPPVTLNLPLDSSPLDAMPKGEHLPIDISARGSGEMHYRISLRYTVPAETAPALDMGIGVLQDYYDLEGRRVDRRQLEAGETYRVVVTISSPLDRSFLALRVPVPAGAVVIDPGFVTSARYEGYPDGSEADGASGQSGEETAYSSSVNYPNRTDIYHSELRSFFDRFPKGRGRVEFLIRAVRPGLYPLPPARAECMYEPEVFGRDAGTLVFIEKAVR
jgi:alpha-2-macroglobulin